MSRLALREELSEEAFAAVYPFYDWLIVHIPWFVKLTDEQLADQAGHTEDRQTEG